MIIFIFSTLNIVYASPVSKNCALELLRTNTIRRHLVRVFSLYDYPLSQKVASRMALDILFQMLRSQVTRIMIVRQDASMRVLSAIFQAKGEFSENLARSL